MTKLERRNNRRNAHDHRLPTWHFLLSMSYKNVGVIKTVAVTLPPSFGEVRPELSLRGVIPQVAGWPWSSCQPSDLHL
ncbi:hypothetical protein T01_6734 [Trichinella spiralis]|uniref:Uncharacterized protein n=1 Tax=Trichinella spiralis TaxID=6334 RepID=A0A0V1BEI3_TRISP|nr:hypothetical protein T01_6734 [Trichinella spiralis]